jgi:hypothetical protein
MNDELPGRIRFSPSIIHHFLVGVWPVIIEVIVNQME